jgi:hypothetical protein
MKHYVGICLVLLTLAAIALFGLHLCTSAVDETVSHVADAFSQVLNLQPQVKIDERVVLSQTAPIAELAVVTREEQISISLDEQFQVLSFAVPLTEKKLTASAVFRLKAGFDLHEPFSVSINPRTHAVQAAMPHAKILSVEQVGDVALQADDALLNRISTDDHVAIQHDLVSAARNAAEASGLKEQAEKEVTQRLNELLAHNGQSLLIDWQKEPVGQE